VLLYLKCTGTEIDAYDLLFGDTQMVAQGTSRNRGYEGEKMSLNKFAVCLPFIFLLAGCDLASVQNPGGSTGYPPAAQSGFQSVTPSQPQVTGSQRAQHIWDTAMQGMAMGAFAGPYGAGGGLIIGLLTGLFTADAHYAQINNQIQSEQAKDKDLEAKVEQELQRQRELEGQLANNAGNSSPQSQPEPQPAQKLNGAKVTTVAMKEETPTAVASLNKKESPAISPSSPFKNVEVKDIHGNGVPDLWIYYNPQKPGEIIRQEESTKGDGRVDTWSYFKDGKMVRREVDTKQLGRPDTVYFYDNDKIVREERDETGQGTMTYRAMYQNGRLAKVEKDTSGSGRTDLWIYYDTSQDGEVVLKEERDLNGDGIADIWTYYENGRIVRRDVNAAGLELLSKQDQLPSAPAVPTQTLRPQLVKDDKGHI
jgi:antitoxin component YwqK of YwqJK toxin-antitoxin module